MRVSGSLGPPVVSPPRLSLRPITVICGARPPQLKPTLIAVMAPSDPSAHSSCTSGKDTDRGLWWRRKHQSEADVRLVHLYVVALLLLLCRGAAVECLFPLQSRNRIQIEKTKA